MNYDNNNTSNFLFKYGTHMNKEGQLKIAFSADIHVFYMGK